MVNRNDDTVSAVLVAGRAVFLNGEPTEVLGTRRTGSFLRANTTTPATTGTASCSDDQEAITALAISSAS